MGNRVADPDPDQHPSDKLDPRPDPHPFAEGKSKCMDMSLYEHFSKV